MPRVHTHYDNLKVSRDAPIEVIRAAYKSLSAKYHPDLHPGSERAAKVMRIINASYEVLSDPAKKAQHDRWIARMEAEPVSEPPRRPEPPPQSPPRTTEPPGFYSAPTRRVARAALIPIGLILIGVVGSLIDKIAPRPDPQQVNRRLPGRS